MISKSILKQHGHHMTEEDLYGAYKVFFGTMVSESRLRIINLLKGGEKNVSEIMNVLQMDQTAVSHDLARLRKCGFVLTEREGKFVYYKLNGETIKPLMDIIEKHMSHYCIHILRSEGGHAHE